jgi:hypothetical protein
MVHSDAGGHEPAKWMTAPTTIEIEGDPPTRIARAAAIDG